MLFAKHEPPSTFISENVHASDVEEGKAIHDETELNCDNCHSGKVYNFTQKFQLLLPRVYYARLAEANPLFEVGHLVVQ